MFTEDPLDKQAIQALCCDDDMQNIAIFVSKVERFLTELATILADLQGLPVPAWSTEDAKALMSGLATDVKEFQATSVAETTGASSISLAHICRLQANMTLGQALRRDLQPGQTRIGLANRYIMILDKRQVRADVALMKKASAQSKGK